MYGLCDGLAYDFIIRYANRAKNIKNKPHINEDPKDALLREYQEEITRLKTALEKRRKGAGGSGGGGKQRRRKVNAQGEGTFTVCASLGISFGYSLTHIMGCIT